MSVASRTIIGVKSDPFDVGFGPVWEWLWRVVGTGKIGWGRMFLIGMGDGDLVGSEVYTDVCSEWVLGGEYIRIRH